ncbi:sigma factor-like helix-turn-helix DNA-binding protein [Streptomyces sp. NBC_01358]|uniref:sigma-70 region 4 domain-containing protein n=1 Tax=Streptomyces sp. NBC_01358 TaxID=2903837 RepID=UPI002E2F391C|nr:sigma factor-like helix-turn-helix DNA-binding protein [Streptomyces sp. NBC_01358]
MTADLGFAAFVERNRPRYQLYAGARLPAESGPSAVVNAVLVSAGEGWDWLLRQPCPAADVWQELSLRAGRQADRTVPYEPTINSLYGQLPTGCADSVLLCRRLGFGIEEAAELMGAEPSTVEAALAFARRVLPHLAEEEHL